MKHRLVAALALLLALPLPAQQPPKPPIDRLAPPTADAAKEKEKPKWDVANPPGSSSTPAPTASARAWASTGRSGCSSRAASRRSKYRWE